MNGMRGGREWRKEINEKLGVIGREGGLGMGVGCSEGGLGKGNEGD